MIKGDIDAFRLLFFLGYIERQLFQFTVYVSQSTVTDAANECLRHWATCKGIKKNIEAVILDGFGIFFLPITGSDNHVLGTLRSKEVCLFLAPDDIEEMYSESLATFVEHSA